MTRKKYTKIEAPFTTKLIKWMRYNMKFTYGWEVKYPKKEKYYFSQDKSFYKELFNLLSWDNKFIFKFSDESRRGTPHDGITIWNEPAYFFFTWDGKVFYAIEVKEMHKYSDDNLFITEKDANEIFSVKSKLGEVMD